VGRVVGLFDDLSLLSPGTGRVEERTGVAAGELPVEDWSYMVARAGAEVSPGGSPRRAESSGRRRGFAAGLAESREEVAERAGKGSAAAGRFGIGAEGGLAFGCWMLDVGDGMVVVLRRLKIFIKRL
jgi:hypothetical protein